MARKEKEIAWTMDAIGGMALVVEYDFKGIITYVNSLMCTYTGYSKDELIGKHHSILFDKKDVVNSDNYNQFWDNMHNKIPFEGIMKRLNKFNKPFVVKGHCHPIFDEDGQPIKVVEVSVDVSEFLEKKKGEK
jgi:methyl-accepting chemotaxis protein